MDVTIRFFNFFSDIKIQVFQIQELFTESKKLDALVSYVVSKSDVSKTFLLVLP